MIMPNAGLTRTVQNHAKVIKSIGCYKVPGNHSIERLDFTFCSKKEVFLHSVATTSLWYVAVTGEQSWGMICVDVADEV